MFNKELPRPNGLSIGSLAPILKSLDINNNYISLVELLEVYNGILIDFFIGSWWSHWKEHLTSLTNNIGEFGHREVKILSIANDTQQALKKFKEENNFKIDIIADKGAKIAKQYDVYWIGPKGKENIKLKQAIPSKFLINQEQKIVWTYICKEKTDRPSIKMMTDAIDKLL